MLLLFKNFSPVEIRNLLIKFNKIKFFPWITKNHDRSGINKQNTHTYTKHSEKDIIGEG